MLPTWWPWHTRQWILYSNVNFQLIINIQRKSTQCDFIHVGKWFLQINLIRVWKRTTQLCYRGQNDCDKAERMFREFVSSLISLWTIWSFDDLTHSGPKQWHVYWLVIQVFWFGLLIDSNKNVIIVDFKSRVSVRCWTLAMNWSAYFLIDVGSLFISIASKKRRKRKITRTSHGPLQHQLCQKNN